MSPTPCIGFLSSTTLYRIPRTALHKDLQHTIPYHIIPHRTTPYHPIPYITLCTLLSSSNTSHLIPTLPYTALPRSTLTCPVLSCPVLSSPILSSPVLSCPVLSSPVLSCPLLSCPVLSSPVLYLTASAGDQTALSHGRDSASLHLRATTRPQQARWTEGIGDKGRAAFLFHQPCSLDMFVA
jgi:hypothetical protein